MCKKCLFALLFSTFGKILVLRVLPAYRKKYGCLPLNPPAPSGAGGLINGGTNLGVKKKIHFNTLESIFTFHILKRVPKYSRRMLFQRSMKVSG